MKKKYTEELAEWVATQPVKKTRYDGMSVAFLAIRSSVQEAIESGYSLKTVWEHMRATGKFKYSYETFRKHAKRQFDPTNSLTNSKKSSGFVYDSTPNIRDLV
jgi:hypothetical protein